MEKINKKIFRLSYIYISQKSLYTKLYQNRRYAKGKLLDVGCGTKPYLKLFEPGITQYIGLDFEKTAKDRVKYADVVGSALKLPFKKNYFDTVISTQVLEHVPEPQKMFNEIFRVLKPGGNLILTTPHFWPLHEQPHDYYRYTPYGLKYLAEKSGLKTIKIEKTTGFFSMIGQLLSYNLFQQQGSKRSLIRRGAIFLLCFCVLSFFSLLNLLNKNRGDSLDYILVASKTM